jgi:hypothetical protein
LLHSARRHERDAERVNIGGIAQSMADLYALQARINSLHGKTIFNTVRTIGGPQAGGMATGGPVIGPGSATSDSIPAYLSNGEHVWTAREVANAGGHAAVEAMRSQFRFAEGGAVRVRPGSSSQRVSFSPAVVDIRTPWGTQTVELIARSAARSEIAAEQRYRESLDDRD